MIRPLRIFRHYVSGLVLALLMADLTILSVTGTSGAWLSALGVPGLWPGDEPLQLKTAVFIGLGLMSVYIAGLYEHVPSRPAAEVLTRGLGALALWAGCSGALAFSLPALRPGRLAWLLGLVLGIAGVLALRGLVAALVPSARLRERLLFLGATPPAARLIHELEARHPGYDILGYVDDRPPADIALTNGFRVLGPGGRLPEIATATAAGTIVVALTERRGAFPTASILQCKLQGVRVEDWPAFYEKVTGKICVEDLRPSWLVFSEGFRRTRLTRLFKRVADVTLGLGFLLGGWPVFLLVAAAIKLDSPGPVFFRQERVGEAGRLFPLLKFRTMVPDAEQATGPVWATQADPRVTRVGRWLRGTRLDELPQILNVLRGEMSFIGPRPERPHFVAQLARTIPYYDQRHTVRPGITGWAQVCYRYGASLEDAREKLQYDLYYVKNMSPFLDLLILIASIQVVLLGRGAR
jgi:sugar transferase (PEP-CTERM system associated)